MVFDASSLMDILVCPKSHSQLVVTSDSLICVDPDCRLKYEMRDGIPVMLVDEATKLTPEEWGSIMKQHGRNPNSGVELSKNDTD